MGLPGATSYRTQAATYPKFLKTQKDAYCIGIHRRHPLRRLKSGSFLRLVDQGVQSCLPTTNSE